MSAPPPPYPGGSDPSYPPPANPPTGYPPYPFDNKSPQPVSGGYPAAQPQAGAYPPGQAPPPAQYAQPAQPGYGQQQQQQTVVVTQPVVSATIIQTFRESPVQTTCPHCRAQIVTAVHYDTGTLTWLLCVVLCLVGCNLGCCFIPFCIDGCKDVIHSCPNCRQTISRWSRM